jgi:predicted GIY-YIG superfamily endonuclease
VSEAATINWAGKSGTTYKYWIHPIGTTFKEVGGNYIFAKEVEPNRWVPMYVGLTNNLSVRLSNHEKEREAKQKGATHIHAHTAEQEEARLAEELDLCRHWKPPCNDRLI